MEEEKKQTEKRKMRERMKAAAAKAKAKSAKAGSDFKKFAFKGSIIDLAIAVIIGAAFGKIITSLVGDIIMPAIGMLIGDVDFSALKIILKRAVIDPATLEVTTPETAIRYGAFITVILEFFIIAFSIYLMYKVIMAVKKSMERNKPATPPPPPGPTKTEQLLADIKDLLAKQQKEKGK